MENNYFKYGIIIILIINIKLQIKIIQVNMILKKKITKHKLRDNNNFYKELLKLYIEDREKFYKQTR